MTLHYPAPEGRKTVPNAGLRSSFAALPLALLTLLLAIAPLAAPAHAEQAFLTAASVELPSALRSLEEGDSLQIHQVPLGISGDASRDAGATLEVERFRSTTPDARVVIHGDTGTTMIPMPDNVYLRGKITGYPNSRVFLSAPDQGGVRGVVTLEGRYWMLAGAGTGGGPVVGLETREVDVATELASEVSSFECAVDRLADAGVDLSDSEAAGAAAQALLDDTFGVRPDRAKSALGGGATYTARVAVETDWEYYLLTGSDVDDAIDYATDLIAFASTIYEAEIDTTLLLDYISLWTTSSDPWTQSGTFCGLMQLGRYWNDNRDNVDRTIVHQLSGKSSGGGIAWVGVLCRSPFNFDHQGACPALSPQNDNYGGDYGLSGALGGNFDIDNPTSVWDIVVVSHEIGHNFNSPHTHCYEGLGGNAAAVDSCYSGECGDSGCYCGGTSLPCAGSGCGTIMSYCHLLGGGLSNISLTFGDGHPHGVMPERVPDRMNAHVVSQNGSNPGCLTLADDLAFVDGFSGGIGGWSDSEDNAGRLDTNGGAALAPGSTAGLEISVTGDDQTRAFVVDDSPDGDHRYRLRFYFDPNSISMDDNKRHKIATLFSESPSTRRLMTLVLRKDPGAAYRLLAKSHRDDGGWDKTAWMTLSDASHVIEVEWLRSGADNTSDGYLRLWLDGVLVDTVTGIENDGWSADYLRLGFVGGLDVNTAGSSFFDAVEVRRQTYIGPL